MTTKKPEFQDFGITPKDYTFYRGSPWSDTEASNLGCLFTLVVLLLVVFAVGFLYGGEAATATFLLGIIPALFVFVLLYEAIFRFKKSRLLRGHIGSQIKLYEEALATYRVAKEEAERRQGEAERVRLEAERRRQEAERQRQTQTRTILDIHGRGWIRAGVGELVPSYGLRE